MSDIDRVDSIIAHIRSRPSLYFARKSLTGLSDFLEGFRLACVQHSVEDKGLGALVPKDFNEWVAYRTHFRESTSGWRRMILATTKSEEDAFDRFFDLLEEHSSRKPMIVAEFIGPESNARRIEGNEEIPIPAPERIQIVKYTDDPGFFAVYNDEQWTDHFCPDFGMLWGLVAGDVVVHQSDVYERLLEEYRASNYFPNPNQASAEQAVPPKSDRAGG